MNVRKVDPAAVPIPDRPFGFDPLSRAFRSDPWRTYARMRREEPVHRSPFGRLESLSLRLGRANGRSASP